MDVAEFGIVASVASREIFDMWVCSLVKQKANLLQVVALDQDRKRSLAVAID